MITLRTAHSADIPTLLVWDEEPHVQASGGEDDAFDWAGEVGRSVPWREILIAEEDGRPVGVMVVIDAAEEESHYWGDIGPGVRAIDIWIGPADALGRGIGTVMMQGALARCFADPTVDRVLVDPLAANLRAHRFYERAGFRAVGPRRFGEDDCIVYAIERAAFEAAGGMVTPSGR